MAIITLSRQFGAGGRTLGRMIAKKLDYLYLDEIIIEKLAKKARCLKGLSNQWNGQLVESFPNSFQ